MSDDECEKDSGERRPEDTVKILLATDCHLGYEASTKRSQDNDSFITFEEILQHAQTQEVDFILLGGDLFHDSKPSQKVVLQCMELLKKYTLGDREIQVEFLSTPELIFSHMNQKVVNYEHPNMNISMPIFSIHGNHDNPSFASTGSMDLLGASGLINYFGKWSDITHVTIPPMVFRKGRTYVSIYGLSYMNDQRLSRLLRDEKLTLLRAATKSEPFKIMVLHQNRAKHTEMGYVDENKLPGLLDFVFWGHEHECRIEPEYSLNKDNSASYHICQPGSSVATSLSESEAVTKKIGVLKVNRREFRVQSIKLETVRPFVFESISLKEMDIKFDLTRPRAEVICDFVDDYIENVLLAKAQQKLTGHPNQPTIPLIRLRVFYTDEADMFDIMRITRKYQDKVANPGDIILFRKDRSAVQDSKIKLEHSTRDYADINECFRDYNDDVTWCKTVQSQIRTFFERADKKEHLTVLSVGGLNEALKRFVEVADDDAFDAVINHQIEKNMAYMKKFDVDQEQEIIDQLKVYREERTKTEVSGDEERDAREVLESVTRRTQLKTASALRSDSNVEDDDDTDNTDESMPAPARGRGRGSRGGKTGRATKTTTARGRGAAARGTGKAAASKSPLNANILSFAPKANSSIKPTSSNISIKDEDNTSLSQFRARPATQSQRQKMFVEESDSD